VWRVSAVVLIAMGVFFLSVPVRREIGAQASSGGSKGSNYGLGRQFRLGIKASPAIVQADLGRFLWFVDTKVGQVAISNPGNAEASVSIHIQGLAQDDEGRLRFIPATREIASALSVSKRSFSLAPGASRNVNLTLDSGYARRRDSAGLCAALKVRCLPSSSYACASSCVTSPGIMVPVLVRLPGNSENCIAVEDVCMRADDGDGTNRVRIKIRNEGGAYVVANGVLRLERKGSSSGDGGVLGFQVAPGLVLPGCSRWLEAQIPRNRLRVGDYEASFEIEANGKTGLKSSFMMNVDQSGRVAICVP
jgi:hypothetical protein